MTVTHSDAFKRDAVRIALTSGLTRRQVASDLGIGLSTLGKWIWAISDEAKMPERDSRSSARERTAAEREPYIARGEGSIKKGGSVFRSSKAVKL